MASDLDVYKEIPGYKAILKSVLKSQIQLLMEQLSDHTGEESIILTASVHDGTLSHLGSDTGKGFFEGRDEIKSQFLGYCLKTHHKQKTVETKTPYQRSHPTRRPSSQQPSSMKRARYSPMARPQPTETSSTWNQKDADNHPSIAMYSDDSNNSVGGGVGVDSAPIPGTDSVCDSNIVKQENYTPTADTGLRHTQAQSDTSPSTMPHRADYSTTSVASSLPSSVNLPHTQSVADADNQSYGAVGGDPTSDHDRDNSDNIRVKLEADDDEDELQITGMEYGAGQMGHGEGGDMSGEAPGGQFLDYGMGATGEGAYDQSGDQAAYNGKSKANIKATDGKVATPGSDDPNLVSAIQLFDENWQLLSNDPSKNSGVNDSLQFGVCTEYSADELLVKKVLRGKGSPAQSVFRTIIRDAASKAGIWGHAPLGGDITPNQKMAFFESLRLLAPQLLSRRREVWTRLLESLQNRRKYLQDKQIGKR